MDPIELVTTGVAVGGAAIARDDAGRVVFVDGALSGERVTVEITESKKSFRRGRVVDVLEPSDGRVDPACPEVANGCGGCDLAFADVDEQVRAKQAMVTDALGRIGRLHDLPEVGAGPALARSGFRTTIRAGVRDGRAGLRRRRTNDLLPVATCRIAHPLVDELLTAGRFGNATEVTLRVGAASGERMVVTDGDPAGVEVPTGVQVVAADSAAVVREHVAGRDFQVSPRSFFQTRADGASALVAVVAEAVGGRGSGTLVEQGSGTLVDLCCGVGLFAAILGDRFDRVVAVESNPAAVADAAVNLAHLGDRLHLQCSTFERWTPEPASVVIADPSRSGLGAIGVERVVATGADLVVLVSCDAGSLGRDAGLLAAAGYRLARCTLVDLFPDTSHVEVVSEFRKVS